MCGIVSIHTSEDSLDNKLSQMDDMLERILHRGPDSGGKVHVKDQVLLGHRRLAIIDLEHGQQPMVSVNNRYSLIFNGEIYNYLELRQMLIRKGVYFNTCSDTEVLLQMLIHFGAEALKELNGIFAFVFHDRKKTNGLQHVILLALNPYIFLNLINTYTLPQK